MFIVSNEESGKINLNSSTAISRVAAFHLWFVCPKCCAFSVC